MFAGHFQKSRKDQIKLTALVHFFEVRQKQLVFYVHPAVFQNTNPWLSWFSDTDSTQVGNASKFGKFLKSV